MQKKAMAKRIFTLFFLLAMMNVSTVFAQETTVNVSYDDTNYSAQGSVYYNQGVEFLKAKKYPEAITEFRKALRENPTDKSARIQLVNTYLERAQYYNNKAMDYNKAANDIRSAIFYMKYYNNEPAEAKYIADINTMEENLETILYAINADQTPKGHLTMGKSLRAQGEFAAAMTEFQKAVALWRNADYESLELPLYADTLSAGGCVGRGKYRSSKTKRLFTEYKRDLTEDSVAVLRSSVCGCSNRRAGRKHLPSAGTF